jgi:hypothetical protein
VKVVSCALDTKGFPFFKNNSLSRANVATTPNKILKIFQLFNFLPFSIFQLFNFSTFSPFFCPLFFGSLSFYTSLFAPLLPPPLFWLPSLAPSGGAAGEQRGVYVGDSVSRAAQGNGGGEGPVAASRGQRAPKGEANSD